MLLLVGLEPGTTLIIKVIIPSKINLDLANRLSYFIYGENATSEIVFNWRTLFKAGLTHLEEEHCAECHQPLKCDGNIAHIDRFVSEREAHESLEMALTLKLL